MGKRGWKIFPLLVLVILCICLRVEYSYSQVSGGSSKYIECPECGEKVPSSSQFCPECGSKLPKKIYSPISDIKKEEYLKCPECGVSNSSQQKYCSNCGARLIKTTKAVKNEISSFNLKISVDMAGKHTFGASRISSTNDVQTGISICAEYLVTVERNILGGGGILYQIPRSIMWSNENFQFVPIYGVIKFLIDDVSLVGQLGYNMYWGSFEYSGALNLMGGLYYGGGIEIEIEKNVMLGVLYTVNKGRVSSKFVTYDYVSGEVEYSKISISIGRRF